MNPKIQHHKFIFVLSFLLIIGGSIFLKEQFKANSNSFDILPVSAQNTSKLENRESIEIDMLEDSLSDYPFILGNGSFSDPYIIQNLSISPDNGVCIKIENNRDYFLISNCEFLIFSYGIIILNSTNIFIHNCIFSNLEFGIHLVESQNTTIQNNLFSHLREGILLQGSKINSICTNTFSHIRFDAISMIGACYSNLISFNAIFNSGTGILMERGNDNNRIISNNISNQYRNALSIDGCSNTLIKNNFMSRNGEFAINFQDNEEESTNTTINNNTLHFNRKGAINSASEDNHHISENDIKKSFRQIAILTCLYVLAPGVGIFFLVLIIKRNFSSQVLEFCSENAYLSGILFYIGANILFIVLYLNGRLYTLCNYCIDPTSELAIIFNIVVFILYIPIVSNKISRKKEFLTGMLISSLFLSFIHVILYFISLSTIEISAYYRYIFQYGLQISIFYLFHTALILFCSLGLKFNKSSNEMMLDKTVKLPNIWIKINSIFLIVLNLILFLVLYFDLTFMLSGILISINLLLFKKNLRVTLYLVILINLIRMIFTVFWVNHQFWPYFDYLNTYGSIFVILFTIFEIGLISRQRNELTSDSMLIFFGIIIALFLLCVPTFLLTLPKVVEPPIYRPVDERVFFRLFSIILNSLWIILGLAFSIELCQILNLKTNRVSRNIIKIGWLLMSMIIGFVLMVSIVIAIKYLYESGTSTSERLTDILIFLFPSSILSSLFYIKSYRSKKILTNDT
ncbi:hypothetical protein NEF87_003244 [Candidatus Lokiarchaeum ossiferum]|uniref:Periplasmic copper-binding protein NosD beta helix domain-containing protein n=1 Tax=Candidatus Lokiarchaeum ossiferum TaxID=2951803 RepID=A0ABY6HTW8_9ARCH|nr:hypothetical protein NEF87_003244 [Candidatus Lokiarchaeum sp. B-35]